jgi:CDP-diacylglycerol pyrophosphatase
VSWRASAGRLAAALALSIAAFAAAPPQPAHAADPEVLWKLVHDQCVPNQAAHGDPAPCLAVDLARGDAVLKDRTGATQVLLIPTDRVTGVESAVVQGPPGARYFVDAWAARRWVDKAAGQSVPRDDLSLAANSIDGRSQNQLHIHVDCLRADVKSALAAAIAAHQLNAAWAPFPLLGHNYRARTLTQAQFARTNLFRLIAAGDPAARANMGTQTIVVAAVTFASGADGFVLLNDAIDPEAGDPASGEELQDHGCQLLQPAPPAAH